MLDSQGGYSTQDADSEGDEGKFSVWTPDETRGVLGDETDAFVTVYGATRHVNFEGKNVLEFVSDMNQRPAQAEARRKRPQALPASMTLARTTKPSSLVPATCGTTPSYRLCR